MKIVIFGANGATGRVLTDQALTRSHVVTAFTRHPEIFPLRHENLRVMSGDVFDLSSVEQAVAGQDAVLSTLGVPFSRKPIAVYSEGIAHIIQAMKRFGVRRLVCVSSSATDPQIRYLDSGGGFIFEKVLKPIVIKTIGRTTYQDMQIMERLVMESQLDWIIVRPSGLFETPSVTDYQMAEAHIKRQFTSRADLADCMLQQLTTDRYLRKAVAVATFSTQPGLLEFFGKEAIQSQSK